MEYTVEADLNHKPSATSVTAEQLRTFIKGKMANWKAMGLPDPTDKTVVLRSPKGSDPLEDGAAIDFGQDVYVTRVFLIEVKYFLIITDKLNFH